MDFKKDTIYLMCSKGECSIFDQLIKIMKQVPRRCDICKRGWDPKVDTLLPPPPVHFVPWGHPPPGRFHYDLTDATEMLYTHVGLYLPSENITDPANVQYYACREEAGVFLYEEPLSKFDVFEVHLKKPKDCDVDLFYQKTKNVEGSMIADMGYRNLMRDGCMSSAEWTARALNLGFPEKYTIHKLIDFAAETA